MKYAIYDKAADGYLTKMECDTDIPDTALGLQCEYNEYITEAKLLDTSKEAADAIIRIEGFKFMDKGRFVMHSFDDELNDQYIISEAGTPTKVVDSITVDLDGAINVKYGTMACHWSASSLEYAINRMNALQKAKSPKYSAWCNTFDIYKAIPVIDERSCTHYQFIKVTEKGLEEFAKDKEEKLLVAGKEVINTTSLLNKRIEELEKANYKINKSFAEQAVVCAELRVKNTNKCRELARSSKELSDAADALEEVNDKNEELTNMLKEITSYVADIMLATRTTDHDKMISDLMDVSLKMGVKTIDDGPMFGVLVILNTLINIAKEGTDWKRRAEEAICDYTKCNEALGEWKRKCKAKDTDYEMLKNKLEACEIVLESTQDCLTIAMKEGNKTTEQKSKSDEVKELRAEISRLLKKQDLYRRMANSVYGMTIPSRCNGKQAFCDVINGKKILVDEKKYDDLIECVNNISLTYEMMKLTPFSIDRPLWLSGVIKRINDLTK